MSRGKPLADTAGPPKRGDPAGLDWTARRFDFGKVGVEIDSVTCDGREADSAIVLHTNRGRVVIAGTSVLLNGTRLQATLSAALHYGAPKLTGEQLRDVADVLLGLASVREIHASDHAAVDWGRSYLYAAHRYEVDLDAETAADRAASWAQVGRFQDDGRGDLSLGQTPARVLVRADDGARLVNRPWFHRHVRDVAQKADRLSEQRIASLMALVGWESFPLARSSLTVRDPAARSQSVQVRLYVVREGWEELE
jgi:hypothetical protein